MKYALLFSSMVACCWLVTLRSPAAAQYPVPAPTPQPATLSLQSEGRVERAPDVARLSVSIVTNDDNAALSSSKNNDIYNAFKARVATLGLGGDALRTTSYNVVFVPHPPRGLPPEQLQPRYGYITTRTLLVTISPIENVGGVVDAATAAGVTTVGAIAFDLKDRKSAYNAALQAAMSDVRQTAATLAAAGGFAVVRIQSIAVTSAPVPLTAPVPMRMAAATTPTEIAPNGPIVVSAHISVTYIIK